MLQAPINDSAYLATIYRLTAVNFKLSARMLLPSLEVKADGTPAKLTAIPFYYLVSHAAELLLKAALLKRGFPSDALMKRKYRHSISSLLNELRNSGVPVTPDTVRLIEALHRQHEEHVLRYKALIEGSKTCLPPLVAVLEMLDELLLLTRISPPK